MMGKHSEKPAQWLILPLIIGGLMAAIWGPRLVPKPDPYDYGAEVALAASPPAATPPAPAPAPTQAPQPAPPPDDDRTPTPRPARKRTPLPELLEALGRARGAAQLRLVFELGHHPLEDVAGPLRTFITRKDANPMALQEALGQLILRDPTGRRWAIELYLAGDRQRQLMVLQLLSVYRHAGDAKLVRELVPLELVRSADMAPIRLLLEPPPTSVLVPQFRPGHSSCCPPAR